jgi:uncharacterized lipoprotein NlpE involved in copper resistance
VPDPHSAADSTSNAIQTAGKKSGERHEKSTCKNVGVVRRGQMTVLDQEGIELAGTVDAEVEAARNRS